MKSSMRLVFECPWCHKMNGYAMDRGGPIYNGEKLGRRNGKSLICISCHKEITIELTVNIKRKEKL